MDWIKLGKETWTMSNSNSTEVCKFATCHEPQEAAVTGRLSQHAAAVHSVQDIKDSTLFYWILNQHATTI